MWNTYIKHFQAVCIGYKIYLFQGENCFMVERNTFYEIEVHSYDVENNDLDFKTSFYLGNNKGFSCTKVSIC